MPNLNAFKASLTTSFARPSLFDMKLFLPLALGNSGEQLSYRCESSFIPGKSIATDERMTYGIVRKMPYAQIFTDLSVSILCSGDMLEKTLFNQWMDLIINKDTHNVEYYANYITSLELTQYDEELRPTHSYEFQEAYPINVDSTSVSWSEADSIVRLPVTFAYRKWSQKT